MGVRSRPRLVARAALLLSLVALALVWFARESRDAPPDGLVRAADAGAGSAPDPRGPLPPPDPETVGARSRSRVSDDPGVERTDADGSTPIQVVYGSTGEPVPHADVIVRDGAGTAARLEADGQGWIVVPSGGPELDLELELGFAGEEPARPEGVRQWWPVERSAGDGLARVAVRTWPTVVFRLKQAFVCDPGPMNPGSYHELYVDRERVGFARFAGDGTLWWRGFDDEFSEAGLAGLLAYGESRAVELKCMPCSSGTGFDVALREGLNAWPEIEALERLGSLSIRIAGEDAVLASQLSTRTGLFLRRLEVHGQDRGWSDFTTLDRARSRGTDELHADLHFLLPGRYRAQVVCRAQLLWQADLELLPGQELVEPVDLNWPESPRSIEVKLRSRSGGWGDAEEEVRFSIASTEGGLVDEQVASWVERDGATVGVASFPGLEAGDYHVRVTCRDALLLESRERRVRAGEGPVEFWVDDTRARASCRFRVLDAESGRPIERGRVLVDLQGGLHRELELGEGESTLDDLLPGIPLAYRVHVSGFLPEHGEHPGLPASGADLVEHLRRGWGSTLVVRARSPVRKEPRPLERVAVYVDGELAGRTDTAGRLGLRLETRPGAVRVERAGYRIESWCHERLDDLPEGGPTVLWMEPDPR